MPVKYKKLDNEQGRDFYFERSLDLIFSPGCFTVEIDHSGKDVGLPIEDCGEEHYFVGNLVVTDSGTAGHKQENRVTGQQLTITSRNGKETEVFTRTFADGVWSQWRSLARTGMYNSISTTDELLATVESLVNENTRAKEVEESVKRTAVDISSLACTAGNGNVAITGKSMDGQVKHSIEIPAATATNAGAMTAEDKIVLESTTSRLGFYEEVLTLTSADLLPMTWDGTKIVDSVNYNTWVVPLYSGRSYKFSSKPYVQVTRTCSEYPSLGKEMTMKWAGTSFTATEKEKYLVFTVIVSSYDNSDLTISASAAGLCKKVDELDGEIDARVKPIETDIDILNTKLGFTYGKRELTSNDFDGIIWDGAKFVESTDLYNGFIIPINPGTKVTYSADQANNVRTLSAYPSVGSSDYVRARTDLNGDFIAQENECFLFLNASVDTFSSYTVTLEQSGLSFHVKELASSIAGWSKPLSGKTMVCFGDSITEFNDSYGKGYTDYLAEFSGANIVRAGVGGAAFAIRKEIVEVPEKAADCYAALDIPNLVKSWATKDWVAVDNAIAWLAQNKNDDNSKQVQALKDNPIENADIDVVFGGSNDLNMPSFGTPSDTNPLINTCGGIYQIIDSILSVKPDMPIYFFNPLPRMCDGDVWCDDYRKEETDAYGSTSFASLTKRIKECVEYHHIPCCDMYHTIGINRKNIYTYARDGVHVTGAFRKIANRIYGFIMENRIWQ